MQVNICQDKLCSSDVFPLEVLILDYILLQEMGLLEVKHGLLQIAETLDFLHNNARLIHRAISPEVIFFFQ